MSFLKVLGAIFRSIGNIILFLFGLGLAGLGGGCAFYLLTAPIAGDSMVFAVIALAFVFFGLRLCRTSGTRIWNIAKSVTDSGERQH